MLRIYHILTLCLTSLALLSLVSCGNSSKGLLRPNGVDVASDGSLYITDHGNYRIVHLSPDGKILDSFGSFGNAPEQIHSAWDLELDQQGNIYIANLVYDEGTQLVHDGIKVFAPDGTFIREIASKDYTTSDETNTNSPYGIEIDHDQRLWIANYYANTVTVYRTDGTPLNVTFADEEPEFVAVNDIAVDNANQLVYIVDIITCKIYQYRFTATNNEVLLSLVSTFGEYGDQPGQFSYPNYVDVNQANGDLYIGDMGNQRIQIFNQAGVFQNMLTINVENWQILGFVVVNNTVYATDTVHNQIWKFTNNQSQRIEVHP